MKKQILILMLVLGGCTTAQEVAKQEPFVDATTHDTEVMLDAQIALQGSGYKHIITAVTNMDAVLYVVLSGKIDNPYDLPRHKHSDQCMATYYVNGRTIQKCIFDEGPDRTPSKAVDLVRIYLMKKHYSNYKVMWEDEWQRLREGR